MKCGIVGGGIAGLTAAHRLVQRGHQVALYEARPALGGEAGTFEAGGERLEVFYHHLFSSDTAVLGLIEERGLGERMTWRDSKVGFYYGGRIYNFVTPMDLLRFRPISLVDRVRLGLVGMYLRRQKDWGRLAGRRAGAEGEAGLPVGQLRPADGRAGPPAEGSGGRDRGRAPRATDNRRGRAGHGAGAGGRRGGPLRRAQRPPAQ